MVELRAGVLLTTAPSETMVFPTENVDFAILALDNTLYPEFEDADFLSEAEIDFDGKTKVDRVYVGIGFPVCLAKRGDSPTAINLPYITYAGPGRPDVLKRKKLSPEQHVAFEFDRINSLIRGGTRETAPQPAGMSGGPIFRLDHTGNGNHKLVGIMTDWLKHRQAILGAHIRLCREAVLS